MGFVKDSSKVLAGQTIQRILSLIMAPVTARLIGPEDYGIVQTALAVVGLASIGCSFALEASISVADSRTCATQRTIGTVCVGLIASLVFGFGMYLSRAFLETYFSPTVARIIILLSPVYVPLFIAGLSFQNLVGYNGRFIYMPVADLLSTACGYVALVGSYFVLWKDYRCLIASAIVVLSVRVIIFGYGCIDSLKLWTIKPNCLKEIFLPTWSARDFAKYNLASNLLNSASVNLPTTLMAMFFSNSVVGLFSMARNIIYIPTILSGQALGQVFYPKAAEMYREGKGLRDITWKTFMYSCRLAIFPAFFIAATVSVLLPIVFGSKWSGIAPYCLLMLPMVLLNAVQTQIGIGYIFNILGQQHKVLIGNIALLIGRFIPMIILVLFGSSAYAVVLAHSVGGSIAYAILLIWIFLSVSISPAKAFVTWSCYCFISAICVLPVWFSLVYGRTGFSMLCVVFSVAIYTVVFWHKFLDHKERMLILAGIKNGLGQRRTFFSNFKK